MAGGPRVYKKLARQVRKQCFPRVSALVLASGSCLCFPDDVDCILQAQRNPLFPSCFRITRLRSAWAIKQDPGSKLSIKKTNPRLKTWLNC